MAHQLSKAQQELLISAYKRFDYTVFRVTKTEETSRCIAGSYGVARELMHAGLFKCAGNDGFCLTNDGLVLAHQLLDAQCAKKLEQACRVYLKIQRRLRWIDRQERAAASLDLSVDYSSQRDEMERYAGIVRVYLNRYSK